MKILLLIIFIIFINKDLYSKNLFETPFYNVEFKSSNIENDKISKIKEITNKSILIILEKTLNYKIYNELKSQLSDDFINTLIKNIIINDEKVINNKYFAKIKINFDKKKIIDFYRKKNFPYVEYYPDKFLLIIYQYNLLDDNLFTKNNKFYSYINNNLVKNEIFKVPNLDINDRYILSKENVKNRNIKKINYFAKKYNLDEIIVVIANTTNNKIDYDLIILSNEKIIEKKLYERTIDIEKFFKNLQFESINIWKEINFIQNKNLNYLNCTITYYNTFELKEIRNNLSKVSVINNLNIRSLSLKSIEYDIYYYGNFKILNNIFKLNRLKVNYDNNICSIKLI